jgi:hypothetical protein
MCPLFNERLTIGEGVRRVSDRTQSDHQEFMKRWKFDPKLGRHREFSEAELAASPRHGLSDEPMRPLTEFEIQQQDRKEREEKERRERPILAEQERQRKLAAEVKAKYDAARLQMQTEEVMLDAMYATAGASSVEQRMVNNKMVSEKRYGNVAAHRMALAELRAR